MKHRPLMPLGTLILACLLAVLMLITYVAVRPKSPPPELEGVLRAEFRPLAPFTLQSRTHGPFTEKNLKGHWTFVFFGYTSCPDVCPNTLHELAGLHALIEDAGGPVADKVQVLFVSVDPARDSAETLAGYVGHFDRDFIGATAGEGAIERLAAQFGAGYEFDAESAPGQYLVAHSSAIFLVDPYGRLVASFSQPHYAATLLAQFRRIVDYYLGNR